MRLGIFSRSMVDGTVDDVVAEVRAAHEQGFASFWASQIFGQDALTVLALAGREVPGIELGTSVVPTYPRHPTALAQQALSTNAACDGRLCLGIGLSHQIVIEAMFGLSFDKPVRHLREYLSVLLPLLPRRGRALRRRDPPHPRHGLGARCPAALRRGGRAGPPDAASGRLDDRRDHHVVCRPQHAAATSPFPPSGPPRTRRGDRRRASSPLSPCA